MACHTQQVLQGDKGGVRPLIKERNCSVCGTVIIKEDGNIKVITNFAKPVCPTCQKILLGDDKPEYWTKVVE
jgi:endogenous inhibitor of DNA gyrase (YacG/DUF329 family)